ncbi:glycosyltransferase family A protein [Peredibacter sp. HCB2-198]|uniref:glycosyltransferase family A protein n=1 Tax=Peredibacter sp. HCB2-198 TaxID=3383025 RepID=UPI0038B5DE79
MIKKFIFAVITYNHESYIIEHMESIKFLILTYGQEMSFKFVLADDGSKDRTVECLKTWLDRNNNLFDEVVIIADGINRGTCINYTNLWSHIDSSLFKITAGDDVYSYVNLFEHAENLDKYDYISGMPLLLIDGKIVESKSTIFHTIATKHIFKNKPFRSRLQEISVMNTPNLLYSVKFIHNKQIENFIRSYKVTEDLPMMVKVTEEYKDVSFHQLDDILVYYRRTSGSTYLIRENDFNSDKVIIFNHMIKNETGFFKRLLLKNRVQCYQDKSKWFKKFCNLNYYFYFLRLLITSPYVLWDFLRFNSNLHQHIQHYKKIRELAAQFKTF